MTSGLTSANTRAKKSTCRSPSSGAAKCETPAIHATSPTVQLKSQVSHPAAFNAATSAWDERDGPPPSREMPDMTWTAFILGYRHG